ncbi:glycosyltransferase [Acuticoccus sp.]|uniref:glycosyltransferase n=1 Tax=Acuticoccus sp. TaxID=1904378 RepID=UPI003B52E518
MDGPFLAEPASSAGSQRPIGFFVHHQGRGHARRCEAIIAAMEPRPITIFTADPSILSPDVPADVVALPNMIGAAALTEGLFGVAPPDRLHCVPLGVPEVTETMARMVAWVRAARPALMVVDVSAEIALLMRLLSVPAIKIRMHGDRADPFHLAAYDACVGLLAPFDEAIEQPDYPGFARRKTCYTGGLCPTNAPVPDKAAARHVLGLPQEREVVVAISGGGGTGTPYAPLTMAARARPDALWLAIGPLHREGHETDFANLTTLGWVPDALSYIAAADCVVASAGDTTVTEVARVGRPFLCVPEWRYFDEQVAKAREMARVGACATLERWPASSAQWLDALARAEATDIAAQRRLFAPDAADRAARFVEGWADRLWREPIRLDAGARPTLEIVS